MPSRVAKVLSALAIVATLGAIALAVVSLNVSGRIGHLWNCSAGTDAAPTWSHDGKTIAFGMHWRCNTQVFVVHPDGSGLQRLASSRDGDELPFWSSDDRHLYVSSLDGLSVIDVNGKARTRISGDLYSFGGALSPKSGLIAYSNGVLPGPEDSTLESTLYLMNRHGTRVGTVIRNGVRPGTPAWSPNGTWLAVTGDSGLYVVHPDGTRLHSLRSDSFGSNPVQPAWSPDGKTIAYSEEDILVFVNAKTRAAREIKIPNVRFEFGDSLSWAPDGRRIVFSAMSGKRPGIYVGDANDIAHAKRIVPF